MTRGMVSRGPLLRSLLRGEGRGGVASLPRRDRSGDDACPRRSDDGSGLTTTIGGAGIVLSGEGYLRSAPAKDEEFGEVERVAFGEEDNGAGVAA